MSEVIRLLQEGVSPTDLDRSSTNMGWPVGSATLLDEVGVDVGLHVAKFLGEALGQRMGGSNSRVLDDLVTAGFLGRKSGRGVYLYQDGRKDRDENSDAVAIFKRYSVAPVAENTPEHIAYRIFSRFINE